MDIFNIIKTFLTAPIMIATGATNEPKETVVLVQYMMIAGGMYTLLLEAIIIMLIKIVKKIVEKIKNR